MMKRTIILILTISMTLLILSCSTNGKTRESKNTYYWYDGTQKRSLTIDSQKWVEFSDSSLQQSNSSSQDSADKQQLLEKTYGNAKLYNLDRSSPQTKSATLLSIKENAKKDNNNFSPVFNDNGKIKALPGGVIVAFKTTWNEQKITQWANQQNLKISRPLIKNINLWLIHSDSGISSLNLANKINEQGEVRYATPNWWQPYELK